VVLAGADLRHTDEPACRRRRRPFQGRGSSHRLGRSCRIPSPRRCRPRRERWRPR
jgi:hypothetical protein